MQQKIDNYTANSTDMIFFFNITKTAMYEDI